MTKAKALQRKNTSDFVTCWLPIILLGVALLLSNFFYLSSGLVGSFENFLTAFSIEAAPFMTISFFVLKKANKTKIALAFSIASTICWIVLYAIVHSDLGRIEDYVAYFAWLICDILMILFVALPDTKIKSFFFVFPLLVVAVMTEVLPILLYGFYSVYVYSGIGITGVISTPLQICLIGFLTTNVVPASQETSVPKNSSAALSRLENLSKLKEQGILTEDEFQEKKAEVMEQI